MNFIEYDKIRFKEGQRLLADDKLCIFVEEDECYGMLWVRFDGEKRDRTVPVESIQIAKEKENKCK